MTFHDATDYVLTIAEVAAQMEVTTARVRQLIADGRIDAPVKRSGAWFFRRDAAQTYKRQKPGPKPRSKPEPKKKVITNG